MRKKHYRDSGEDLWNWAERRDTANTSRVKEMPHDAVSDDLSEPRQPKGMARVLSVLGIKSRGKALTY